MKLFEIFNSTVEDELLSKRIKIVLIAFVAMVGLLATGFGFIHLKNSFTKRNEGKTKFNGVLV